MLKDCDDAFGRLEELVEKARTKKKETIKLGVVKRIEWAWKEKEVFPLKCRFERCKSTLKLMLQALNWSVVPNHETC